ncbi:aromatic ring-hydroxylating oxygenase subunit alpha [Parendozoicomonas haliclonae]|uniref:Salicylate 5-hydroxylase, large oxygenase component n=1 Tax=Parendozoicomonas haliclonae TaxID=1960125 RepID=A0A1X7ANT7_9GAMM|nr:aromatic ring-hydroxylating dioxygenase subunit alpha [Parendozoicomonas haliclonae]SMA49925.1 Salicylate 5-hydroxylase, large oxygenase component [Parendozoicomonas haliclonae]
MNNMEELKALASASAGEALSLPYWAYTSEEVYEQECQKIFHKDWVFACNEFEIPEPGDKFAFILAGEPVVIIRGKDGELRAMSNSCRHRGTLLADEGFSSGTNNLVCPYHAWNYTEEGKLRGLPFSGNVKVDKEKHCLPRFALEVWHGLVFVNIDGTAEPLKERYAELEAYIKHNQPQPFNSGYEAPPEYWDSNWKLAMENAMESYHLFKVHKPTLEQVTPTKGAFYLQGNALWSITGGQVHDITPKWMKWFTGGKPKMNENYILFSLPPSFVGVISSDGLFGYITVLPAGPGRTYTRGGGVGVDIEAPKGVVKKFVDDFFEEDKFICERAYKGMTARAAPGGQLVELERIVVDFHQYLAMRLFNHQPDETFKDEEGEKKLFASAS